MSSSILKKLQPKQPKVPEWARFFGRDDFSKTTLSENSLYVMVTVSKKKPLLLFYQTLHREAVNKKYCLFAAPGGFYTVLPTTEDDGFDETVGKPKLEAREHPWDVGKSRGVVHVAAILKIATFPKKDTNAHLDGVTVAVTDGGLKAAMKKFKGTNFRSLGEKNQTYMAAAIDWVIKESGAQCPYKGGELVKSAIGCLEWQRDSKTLVVNNLSWVHK